MKKTVLILAIGTIFFVFLTGCQNKSESILKNLAENNLDYTSNTNDYYKGDYDDATYSEESEYTDDYEPEEATVSDDQSDFQVDISDIQQVKTPDKIIKTANISVEVKNYADALKQIKAAINKWGGYISSENENEYGYMISNYLTIRVESKNFENLVNDITVPVEKVVSKSITAMDVTEEFIDIEARLKTKREVEQRYMELLRKSTSVQDILYIEDKIRVIREEIEAKEGRLKYLKDQVSYSTINLDIKEYFQNDVNEPGFFEKSGKALSSGWKGFLAFLIGLLYLWPLWLITGVGLYVLLKLLNRKKKRQQQK
ncbi:MAG: hypothetical protein Kow0068_08840 [Marinilabiliales bacterium]